MKLYEIYDLWYWDVELCLNAQREKLGKVEGGGGGEI